MKKQILFLTILIIAMFFVQPVHGAGQKVTVTIPDFPVTLNDSKYDDNDYMIYPMLMYKNITYFPMTYYRSNLLNLNTSWSASSGLVIMKSDPETPKATSYEGTGGSYNKKIQTVSLVNSKVNVNGKVIDNQKEPYPLLQFRDIVYFPLTWRFAVEEFGWSYNFDKISGLEISVDNYYFYENLSAFYKKGDLEIGLLTRHNLTGIVPGNLYIIKNGVKKWIGGSSDYFGYYQEPGPIFTIKDGFIYTTHLSDYDDKTPRSCRINIGTSEILMN